MSSGASGGALLLVAAILSGASAGSAETGSASRASHAVDAALDWLKRHQSPDGSWEALKWESQAKTDPGVTGLALLAFLRAGHNGKEGEYKDVVTKAVAWIVSKQAVNGCIGSGYEGTEPAGVGYHHPICGLALAEAFRANGNEAWAGPAQKAVDYSVGVHQIPGSGWRYTPRAASETTGAGAGVADLSVTGWFVMQLKSAEDAGLKVPKSGKAGALAFIDRVTNRPGRCSYQPTPPGGVATCTPSMTAVGACCRLLTGTDAGDPGVNAAADHLAKASLPEWGENGCRVDLYCWFHATSVMAALGGERARRWNKALLATLCDNQRKADHQHPRDDSARDVDGSWDPLCLCGARGGRACATAMGALALLAAGKGFDGLDDAPVPRVDPAPTPEESAAQRLDMAANYRRNGMDDRAREILQSILKDFPDTGAAARAREALDAAGAR